MPQLDSMRIRRAVKGLQTAFDAWRWLAAFGVAFYVACALPASSKEVLSNKYYVDSAYYSLLEKCAISHPGFNTAILLLRQEGFDETPSQSGGILFAKPVHFEEMTIEVKKLENGNSHCIAYYSKGTTDQTDSALNQLVSVFTVGNVQSGAIGAVQPVPITGYSGGKSYLLQGPPYNLYIHSYPVAAGGAALVIQVTEATENALNSVGIESESDGILGGFHAYAPTSADEQSFDLLFSFHCISALPEFSHAVARLKSSNAEITKSGAYHVANWPPTPLFVFVERSAETGIHSCSVGSTFLSLDQTNQIGRVQAGSQTGRSTEQQMQDGTRLWVLARDWIDTEDARQNDFDYVMRTYQSANGNGLTLEARKR